MPDNPVPLLAALCSTFNSFLNKDEKYDLMERLTSRDKDDKLTVRVRAPVKQV